MQEYIRINKDDNVAVALKPLDKGTVLNFGDLSVTLTEDVPQGHKVAIKPIANGGDVIKYGFRIGHIQEDVEPGTWVHTHNLKTALGDLNTYTYQPTGVDVEPTEEAFLMVI